MRVTVLVLMGFVAIGGWITSLLLRFPDRAPHRWTREQVRESISRGDTIVSSLEAYKARHGRYPASLGVLFPEFQKAIQPPVAGNGRWSYETFADGADYTLAFEDDLRTAPSAWNKPGYERWAIDYK